MEQEGPSFEADTEREMCKRRKVFEVRSVLVHNTRALGSYKNDLCVKKLFHMSVDEIAVSSWCVDLPWPVM